jgi:phage tail-like protein
MFGQFSNRESGKASARVLFFAVGILLVVAVVGQLLGWWAGLLNQGTDLNNLQGNDQEQMAALSDEIEVPQEPQSEFICMLKLGDILLGHFSECYGLGSETDVVENKVVKDGVEITVLSPGQLRYTPVTLRRGITSDLQIWQWRQFVVDGDMAKGRVDATIDLLDPAYNSIATWELKHAWPSAISAPMLKDLDGRGFHFGVEELVIVHEELRRTK